MLIMDISVTGDISQAGSLSKADSLAKRYGAGDIPAAGPWNDHIASLLSHRSVRGYRTDALPEGTLETLVAAGQSAATSSNLQTWSVISVSDPHKKAALAKLANNQKHIQQCPLFLVWVADLSRNARLGEEEGVMLETIPYFESYLVAAIDAALAAQNATVAAESIGLSCVYIGALRNNPIAVGEILGLPPGTLGVFGMCVGYPLPTVTNEVKPRLPQSVILHHNTYGVPNEREQRAAYDSKMSEFSQRHEMSQDNWTKRVIGRMGNIAALSGRHTLVATLNAMGFPLR
jgi:nitroreductase